MTKEERKVLEDRLEYVRNKMMIYSNTGCDAYLALVKEEKEIIVKLGNSAEEHNMSTTKTESPIVYMLTGIVPYSGGERTVIYVYLDKEKANKRYEELRNGSEYYLDVQMDTYEVDE